MPAPVCSSSCPRYEGFGLTPLEAMAHGLPTVVLDTAVAREVYGDRRLVRAPKDAAAVLAPATLLRTRSPCCPIAAARRRRALSRRGAARCPWDAIVGGTARRVRAVSRGGRRWMRGHSLSIVIVSYNVRATSLCLPGVGARPSAPDRGSRSSTTGRPTAPLAWLADGWPDVRPIDAGGISASRARTTSASGPRRASSCCC